MNRKRVTSLISGTIIGGALFLSISTPIFADDTPVVNLYNNPSIQSLMQQNSQSVQWANGNNSHNINDIRTQLHNALKIHTVVGGIAFIARYENSGYSGQIQQQVQQNTDQVTNLIGQLYGQNIQNDFRTLWTNHITLLNQYVDERKMNNNNNQLQQTDQQLQDTVNRLADLFSQNNTAQRDNIRQMLQMHVDEEKAIIDTHAARRDSDLLNLFLQAANHADMLADAILQNAHSPFQPSHPYQPSPTGNYMYRVQ